MKFYIATLGCKVNSYESSVMHDDLINHGYIKTDTLEDADICILNTCTVTNSHAILIVAGCMIQVLDNFDNIDADIIIGNMYKSKISSLIDEYKIDNKKLIKIDNIMESEFESMMLNNFEHTRAFVKIEDGC